jgi:hypothetical protein
MHIFIFVSSAYGCIYCTRTSSGFKGELSKALLAACFMVRNFLLCLLFDPEDVHKIFLRNLG